MDNRIDHFGEEFDKSDDYDPIVPAVILIIMGLLVIALPAGLIAAWWLWWR